jgi:two-component system, NarL family, invasion response regulator UvrY
MTKTRILIADDHSAIRNGIRHILSPVYSELEFGEATDISEVFRKLSGSGWDLVIVILDINMPGRSGFEVLEYLKEENSKTPVLVFSFHREEQVALRALKSGASGYLSKDADDAEMITAVKHLLCGRKYITPSVSEQLIDQLQSPNGVELHELLSAREFQIMLLLVRGKTMVQIAYELNLSASTIYTYRARLLDKMHAKDNADLISYAKQHKLS